MNPRETIAEQIFGEALDVPQEQRNSYLNGACRGDTELREMVEGLLRENDRLDGFLSESPFGRVNPPVPTASREMAPGFRLTGRYRIKETLGAGGMGVVYRAHDETLDREVAIKMLRAGVLTDEESKRRFRREARALAKLNDARIAAVYDVIEADSAELIVMELVGGESLAARLSAGAALGARDATAIALQVAEALQEAQLQGVIHRDLKPANVMITPKGQVKVLDFGLAKLLEPAEVKQSLIETQGVMGTPFYMSPEQAQGKAVDGRTDLWSLGVMYYELLAGEVPFQGDSEFAILQAIARDDPKRVSALRPETPKKAESIVGRALEKDREKRYATATEMAADLSALLVSMRGVIATEEATRSKRALQIATAGLAVIFIVVALTAWWFYRRIAEQRWAREEAVPKIASLMEARLAVQAFRVLQRAERDLPGDPHLKKLETEDTQVVTVISDPTGAEVSLQDYLTPGGPELRLGTTPLTNVRIPSGSFRWKVAKAEAPMIVAAPETNARMFFDLARQQTAPVNMVYAEGGDWGDFNGFIGWMGPYRFAPYYIDRYEVTNREYQSFVDHGGYENSAYWPATFTRDGKKILWTKAMEEFRDSTGRPGPASWAGGHYPEGKADDPVSGVSWFEAAAYAHFAGKALPVVGQWYQAANFDISEYTAQLSNLRSSGLAQVGKYQGLGQYGTYDMAGNVREWIENPVDRDLRFILGGSWRSPNYLYTSPEALSPYDRSDTNGFRCVKNLDRVPAEAAAPIHRVTRDFTKYTPVSDAVFRAYELLYAYPKTPLNVENVGVVRETEDWREEKVTFDAAYNGERMSAYLFLPKRVKPPYQTVLFFPSARVLFLPPDSSELGDINYFDYVIQSGRAVMYPVYEDTYERQLERKLPFNADDIDEPVDWYKDAARSLDYLQTRPDIDNNRIAYLGVSMGAADGAIYATLLQDRLRTAIFLDGGYFLVKVPPGVDQADFVPRMKKPVLMVNGRYDYTFPVDTAQNPLFRMLGTPASDKRHVILDTPHDVSAQRPELVKEVLDWLDKYLGRVGERTENPRR
jgi:eukaryotic-like serine/threonine-protein kinase